MKNCIALLIILIPVFCIGCVTRSQMASAVKIEKTKYDKKLDNYKNLHPLPIDLIARQKQAEFTDMIGTWLSRIGVISGLICVIAFALTFVSNFPTKALTRVACISGVIAIVCMTSLVGLAYWKIVCSIIFFVLIIYGGFKMWDMRESHIETRKQLDESIEHFDDPKGIKKLSKNTRITHAIAKGKKLIAKEKRK